MKTIDLIAKYCSITLILLVGLSMLLIAMGSTKSALVVSYAVAMFCGIGFGIALAKMWED